MAAVISEADLARIAKLPEKDLEDILVAIRGGAKVPAEAMGFDEPTMNAIERIGVGFYSARKFREAVLIFGFMLQMDPLRGSAWRGLGAAAQAQHNLEFAAMCYEFAIDHDPKDVVARVFLGETFCELGRPEEGLLALKNAIAVGTDVPALKAYLLRARAIIAAGGGKPSRVYLSKKARKLAEQAAALTAPAPLYDPTRPMTVEDMRAHPELRARLKDLEQQLKRGRITLAEIGGFTKKELDGTYAMALQMFEGGKIPRALQLVGYLILIDPHQGRFYQLAGICLQRLNQYTPANLYYRSALVYEPGEPRSLVYLGECQIMTGETDEGLATIREGIKVASGKRGLEDVVKRGESLLARYKK